LPDAAGVPLFVAFGTTHLCALAIVALLSLGLVGLIRAKPHGRAAVVTRCGLALTLVGVVAATLTIAAREHWLSLEAVAPLHLCDAAVLLAIYALATLQRLAAELLYFWACSGTALAMLSPDLTVSFPRWEFIVFFALHGLVVAAALVLVVGLGLPPRPGAAWRAFAATNLYAAVVGSIDALAGTNYLYLCSKPGTKTLLDLLGPWPVYLLACDALALLLFWLLSLPFRTDVATEEH
jgi:hypothetical integral membrane protein (TIGR02206 family)